MSEYYTAAPFRIFADRFWSALVLTTGFLVYLMAFMKNIQIMGTICAFIIVMAFQVDVMLVPAIMKIITNEKVVTVKKIDIQMPNSLKQ